ncbi:rabankyrin-5-like, partial, partial [Argonauta hians]
VIPGEVTKLQNHLSLLREEYVKIQERLAQVEQKYEVAVAAAGGHHVAGDDSFVSRLLKTVGELFNKEAYSDITILLQGGEIKAHKFIMKARSPHWGPGVDISTASQLDLTDISQEVASALLKWVYTDDINIKTDEKFLLELLKVSARFQLDSLGTRCENALMSFVTVKNCIQFYQSAEEMAAELLKKHCSELISSHWDDFTSEDFANMPAALLYKMFKSKSEYVLHTAIRVHREDVVFLYLIEYDSHLNIKLNEVDTRGDIPLDLALQSRQESVAQLLVKHRADVNRKDHTGHSLLHKAIKRGDSFSAIFLIQNKADINATTHLDQECPLHMVATATTTTTTTTTSGDSTTTTATTATASGDTTTTTPTNNNNSDTTTTTTTTTTDGMAQVCNELLLNGANPNTQSTEGSTPLHRAVQSRNRPVFDVLLKHGGLNLELKNVDGQTALWLALQHGDVEGGSGGGGGEGKPNYGDDSFSARLLKAGSSVNAINSDTGDSLLMQTARAGNGHAGIFLADHGALVNHVNIKGETALHIACSQGLCSLAGALLEKGANPNAQTVESPPSALQQLLLPSAPSSSLSASSSSSSQASHHQLSSTTTVDHTTTMTTASQALYAEDRGGGGEGGGGGGGGGGVTVGRQTPLHLAILYKYEDIVELFLQHKAKHMNTSQGSEPTNTTNTNTMAIVPNFNLKDSEGQSSLGLTLWGGLHQMAIRLLSAGANINETNVEGLTLLHQALHKQDVVSALFLLDHHVDTTILTPDGDTPLQLSIKRHLPVIVESLCAGGVNLNVVDREGKCPLWLALDSGQEDIAHILVKHGCDVDMWSEGPDQCQQTLLHQAIDENNEAVSCFLIRSSCDKNSPRKPGPNGEGGEEARDGQTPLHLSCAWGLELVVQCLMEHGADVNIQDSDGNCPLHIAIQNQHSVIISLLLAHPNLHLTLRNSQGLSPFAVAMTTKDNKAAQAILNREPSAAEQTDNKGRNFLHTAIMSGDIESVLFLISVHADVNSRVQDSQHYTALHLAVMALSEIITRNLILAGADVNERTPHGESALHLSAMHDSPNMVMALLENGVDINAVDDNHNNALHVAVSHGNLKTIRCLLTESSIEAEVANGKGQNPLHILCQYGKDNAAAIFELFREAMPDYPIDTPDLEGNTALLLAYLNGHGALCRALVRSNACLGVTNKHGCSIFNATVASKQLIFKLLDMLSKEPPWCDGETCLECGVKFGIKTRKHHCRHCGRLLCAKCSTHDIPIVKYNLTKPVRVCDICFDVLSLGGNF